MEKERRRERDTGPPCAGLLSKSPQEAGMDLPKAGNLELHPSLSWGLQGSMHLSHQLLPPKMP